MAQTLDLHEFVEASKILYNTLNVADKNRLLASGATWDQKKEDYCFEARFEPQINKKSKKLAQRNRDPEERLEDMLVRKKKETEEKLTRIRRSKYNDELKG